MAPAGNSTVGWADGFCLRRGDLLFGQGHDWPLILAGLLW